MAGSVLQRVAFGSPPGLLPVRSADFSLVNRQLARIQLRNALAYYRRLGKQAITQAGHRWLVLLGPSAAVAAIGIAFGGTLVGLLAFVVALLVMCVWFLLSIPPLIEHEMQQKEEVLRRMSERRGIATELRNLTVEARTAANKARGRENRAEAQDGNLTPPAAEEYHEQALSIAGRAVEVIQKYEGKTGHATYVDQMDEINRAVSSRRVTRADEAIEQLEDLADVFDRQILSNRYW